jgi:hypothetical protein
MDDASTFDKALQDYKDAYVSVNMVRAPPNTLAGPRNAILGQLERLQTVIETENAEIKNFADKSRLAETDLRKTALEARTLRSTRGAAEDELTRTKRVVGETPPAPDWSPLYYRLGAVGGLVIAVLGARMLVKA